MNETLTLIFLAMNFVVALIGLIVLIINILFKNK